MVVFLGIKFLVASNDGFVFPISFWGWSNQGRATFIANPSEVTCMLGSIASENWWLEDWRWNFLLGWPIFGAYVSFWEGMSGNTCSYWMNLCSDSTRMTIVTRFNLLLQPSSKNWMFFVNQLTMFYLDSVAKTSQILSSSLFARATPLILEK